MKSENPKQYMMFNRDAQQKLVEGASLMYKAVCSTLSPKGRNVAIARQWGAPIVVHDGVTVARDVKSDDKFVQIGINLVREAATKTNEEAGDGTTTSTLIAYETIVRGMKLIQDGTNPMILRKEIDDAIGQALKQLSVISKEAKTQEDLVKVATISSSDPEIGKLVGETVFKVGIDGLVSVEESGAYETTVDHSEGMGLDKGFTSPYFITSPNRMEAVISKPIIIITDREITTQGEIVPIIDYIITSDLENNKNIVIIGNVGGQALQILVTNKLNGNINACAIKAPGYGMLASGFLEDIAVLTGGKVIRKELGLNLEEFANQFDSSYLGHAEKVVADRKSSMIVRGFGDLDEVKGQIKKLKKQKREAKTLPERENLDERIAKLSAGVSVVRVGAKTEIEGREKVERVKDAVGAAQSALREGVVPGSGVTFLRIADAIKGDTDGARLMREVLEQPLRKVMENSGEPNKVIKEYMGLIMDNKDIDYGYEVMSSKLTSMYNAGIIDPTKVIRLCLENGVSVATSILTTDTLIDHVEPTTPGAPSGR